VPFIIVATFTILNLFIGIIVSTMQELAQKEATEDKKRIQIKDSEAIEETVNNIEKELARLRILLDSKNSRRE
jgi:voltage-gated sodium channel